MRELAQWVFEAEPGESVSVRIVPRLSEARLVGVWLDDRLLGAEPNPYSYPYLIYRFTVSKPAGQSHTVKLECNFGPDAPAQARYDLWFFGSFRPREFLRTVNRDDNHDVDIIFAIAQPRQAVEPDEPSPPPAGWSELRGGKGIGGKGTGGKESERTKGWTRAQPPRAGSGGGEEPALRGGRSDSSVSLTDAETEDEESTASEIRPEIRPEVVSEVAPEVRPEIRPEIVAEVAPEARPEIRPEIVSELAPEVRPEIRPEVVPEASPTRGHSGGSRPPVRRKTGPRGALGKVTRAHSRRRVVNVGFASDADAKTPIQRDRPLACGRHYYFWLEVGRPMAQSLEADKPASLPSEQLPARARLKVVLFGFKDEFEIKKGADIGELELGPGGSASVSQAPARPASIEKGSAILGRRLFFPVRTPTRSGTYRLRCSIYYEQLLIQSRLITARVLVRPRQYKNALRSAVDYTLSRTMQPSHLAGLAPHRLSLMVNSNGNGTFGLRVFGETIKDDASFDGQELQDLIDQARGGLRTAAWGDAQPWQPEKQYRYDAGGNFNQLKGDLIRLAKRGYSFYDHIIDRFSGGVKKSKALAALMLKPGHVQIALKESARHILPAAMIYDYPLDGGLKDANFKICESFSKAFNGDASLEDSDCFKGACPTRADSKTVCPSGFWGYRHYLGMPLSDTEDIPTEIAWKGSPHLTIGVSTNLQLRADHQKALQALKPGLAWDYADTRDAVFTSLKESHPHLVYFYCHGGLDHNEPYIKVGPADSPVIVRANLREQNIEWQDPRPLIFINGCHTTALEPEQALEFVTSFVEVANAAGVIGTEITIFESLARSFAEDCLRRFIVDGKSIGEAIREARLALLKAGNPLGLVYIPFVITNLRMVGQ